MVAVPASSSYRWEWLKWLAFVAMVCDHVAVFFHGGEYNALRHFGLIAFPIFCLTFGFGLARARDPRQVARRLLIPCLVAQGIWMGFTDVMHLNVLGVFLLCAEAVAQYRHRELYGKLYLLGLLLAYHFLEGAIFGPLLVAAGYFVATSQRYITALCIGAFYAILTAAPLISFAAVIVTLLPQQPRIAVPRVPGLLLWGYPIHLALLAALSRIIA